MKIIYKILVLITSFCFLYTLSVVLKEALDLTIPDVKSSIIVEEWDKTQSADSIYSKLDKYAKQKNINIHKIVFTTNTDGTPEKKIFTFSKNGQSDYFYDNDILTTKAVFHDSDQLTTENVIGTYVLTSRVPGDTEQMLRSLGLTVTLEKFSPFFFIIGAFFSTMGILSVILFLTTLLANSFYKISQMKKMGIWEICGHDILKMSVPDYLGDILLLSLIGILFMIMNPLFIQVYIYVILLFIFLITVFNILSTVAVKISEDIVEKIKGKKPYKLFLYSNIFFKLLIVAVLVIFSYNLLNVMNENRKMVKTLSKWETIGEYYQLQFSNNTILLPSNNDSREERIKTSKLVNKKMYPLFVESEKKGGILAVNNEYSVNGNQDGSTLYTDKISSMTVNHNFVNTGTILNNQGEKIQHLKENKFYLFIPESEKPNTKQIEAEMGDLIALYQDVYDVPEDGFKGELEIIYTQANQEIFNYNTEYPQFSSSKNPIILVLSLSLIGYNIDNLIAETSQGHYLFKDDDLVSKYILDNNLESEFFGLISSSDIALSLLRKNEYEYRSNLLSLIVLIVVFVLIQFYTSSIYIETEKKQLFLKYIYGKSFLERHRNYVSSIVLLTCTLATVLVIINVNYLAIVSTIVIFEINTLGITLYISEKSARLETIKKEN